MPSFSMIVREITLRCLTQQSQYPPWPRSVSAARAHGVGVWEFLNILTGKHKERHLDKAPASKTLSWGPPTQMAMVQNQWYHFGIGGPIVEPILVGIGIFTFAVPRHSVE